MGKRTSGRTVKALQAMKKKLARLTAEQKFHIDEIAERKGMLGKTEADIVKVVEDETTRSSACRLVAAPRCHRLQITSTRKQSTTSSRRSYATGSGRWTLQSCMRSVREST